MSRRGARVRARARNHPPRRQARQRPRAPRPPTSTGGEADGFRLVFFRRPSRRPERATRTGRERAVRVGPCSTIYRGCGHGVVLRPRAASRIGAVHALVDMYSAGVVLVEMLARWARTPPNRAPAHDHRGQVPESSGRGDREVSAARGVGARASLRGSANDQPRGRLRRWPSQPSTRRRRGERPRGRAGGAAAAAAAGAAAAAAIASTVASARWRRRRWPPRRHAATRTQSLPETDLAAIADAVAPPRR